MNEKELLKLVNWATRSDTGVSSNALCRFMLGLEAAGWGIMAPSDEDDRGRCIRLLNLIPEWWNRLDELTDNRIRNFEDWQEQVPLIKKEANR